MHLQAVDIGIIIVYIVIIMAAGFAMSKIASRNLNSYFLGGNRVPWYILGIADASGMYDITGTMWLVMTLFVYGLKGAFLPWVWPVFNQIFLMVYLSAWLRRSNVMTGGEWIRTRFGDGPGAQLSHLSIVIFALVSVIGFLAYDFRGMGKFAQILLPWEFSANTYAVLLMGVTTLYVIFGGMLSVTVTDVIQYILMTCASICIAVVAMRHTCAEAIREAVPTGWLDLSFGWTLNLDWSGHIESLNHKITEDGWELFGIFFMIMLFKGILVSAAGPAPNYDMQRILSTRSPREASMMNGFVSVVLFFPRYLLVAGIVVLGLVFFREQILAAGSSFDAEQILPNVISRFLPVGLIGFVLAGLLAAFMSTFSSTINAGASYAVNDLYKKYIRSNAGDKHYVYASYLCSVLVVIVGIAFGFMTESINTVTQWLVAGLWGGYTAPNVLKWYWWRFNSLGYFGGMLSGIAAALILPLIFRGPLLWHLQRDMAVFPIILGISAVVSILISLLTPPDEEETLKKFYKQVRPWGLWGPIRKKIMQEDPAFLPNRNFWRDMVNIAVGIPWQLMLVLIPIYLIIRNFTAMWICVGLLAATSLFLKKNWFDKLAD